MKKLMTQVSIAVASVLVVAHANAEVRINGFANFTGGITSSDDKVYGFDDRMSFSDQSLFAIQISGDINDKMTATGQMVARGQDDYDADFEWAYITYEAAENTSVSAGRLRIPLFQYSSSVDVAYSYHWVVAPQAVYSVPFNNIDGLRIDHSGYAGDFDYTFQVALGQVSNEFSISGQAGDLNIDNVAVFNGELAYENWKVRGVYGTGKVTFDIPALDPAFGQLAQISGDLANTMAVTDDTGTFMGISVAYDNYNFFVASEYTVVEIEESFYPEDTSYYITAGLRSGKWTPFVTYEKSDVNKDPKFVDQISAFPAPLQVPLTQLVVGIQQGVVSEDSTFSVGVRYDYDTNVALKADITQFTNDVSDADANLLRLAVNYVF